VCRIVEVDALATEAELRGPHVQDIAKPVRPVEFRSFVAVPFVTLHIVLAVALAVLFFQGRSNGMCARSPVLFILPLLTCFLSNHLSTPGSFAPRLERVTNIVRLSSAFKEQDCTKYHPKLHPHGNRYID
jgi:uncharacterized protein (DUF2062 family)